MPTTLWTKVEQVFEEWNNGTLKGQPKGPLRQTVFMYLKNVSDEEKDRLLTELVNRIITVKEFQEGCGKKVITCTLA